jgi:WhiB family redox-sensing transcriptional regulator
MSDDVLPLEGEYTGFGRKVSPAAIARPTRRMEVAFSLTNLDQALEPVDINSLRPAWHADAACRGIGPELFYAENDRLKAKEAKALCATCPVRIECRDWGVEKIEHFGIWGGMTARQRSKRRAFLRRNGGMRTTRRGPRASCNTAGGYAAHRRRGEEACAECKKAHALSVALQRSHEEAPSGG